MKSILITVLLSLLSLRSAFGQAHTFTQTVSDPPAAWAIESGQTNSVDVTFDLDGESEAAFKVTVASCGDDTAHYSLTQPATLTDLVLTGNNPLTVEMTNLQHIDVTTYCFTVSLFAPPLVGAISTTTYNYVVDALETNTIPSVTVDKSSVGNLETVTDTGAGVADVTEAVRAPVLPLTIPTDNAIKFGETIQLSVAVLAGYQARINSVSPVRANTFTQGAFSSGTHTTNMELPLTTFTNSAGAATVTITCELEWRLTPAVRRLRGLETEGGAFMADSGTTEMTIEVELEPLNDGSGGYRAQILSMGTMAFTAGAAALLI